MIIRITNYFVTGKKGSGKSYLLEKIIKELEIKPVGYITKPYFIDGERKGFYLKGLVEMKAFENNWPICIQNSECSCIPILNTFNELGVKVLDKSLSGLEKVIVMDEIGILESKAEGFTHKINKALDSDKIVIGALKKSDNEFLNSIRNREDILIFDLDIGNRDEIYNQMIKIIRKEVMINEW